MSHYFIAIELNDDIKEQLFTVCKEYQQLFHFNKWVHKEDYHLTLAFLGQSSDIIVERTMKSIEQALQKTIPFTLHVNHFNVFGKEPRPQVFWAGVAQNKQLFTLQNVVSEQCELHRFTLDERPFTPHITLARQWNKDKVFHTDLLKTSHLSLKIQVNKITLFQTMIGQVPKYKAIHQVNLLE